jgi:hypothetical protein
MTTTLIPAETREQLLCECGAATERTLLALNLWESGERYKAVLAMWEDGADEQWIELFTGALGCGRDETDELIGMLQAWSGW